MAFQSTRKYKIAVSPLRLFSMPFSPHSHPQKPTKYLNLQMNISQIDTLGQLVQSTSYPHYLHLSCDVKLKSYSMSTLTKLLTFFTIFYSKKKKKTFAKEKKSIN